MPLHLFRTPNERTLIPSGENPCASMVFKHQYWKRYRELLEWKKYRAFWVKGVATHTKKMVYYFQRFGKSYTRIQSWNSQVIFWGNYLPSKRYSFTLHKKWSVPLTLIYLGFLEVCFEVGGRKITPCLILVRIMLETKTLARKYTCTCSFRKYTF